MKNKTAGVLVCIMMVLTTFIVIESDYLKVVASSGGDEDQSKKYLNFSYIKYITQELSDAIFDAYEPDDIPKGRAFGTEGEHWAADHIIEDEMIDIGLWNVTKEQIENISSGFDQYSPSLNLTNKIEIQSFGITLHNETNSTLSDYHIRPMWNWRILLVAWEKLWPNITKVLEFLEAKFKLNTSDNYKYNMVLNESWLTKNFSYQNLYLRPRPTNISWFFDFLFDKLQEILNNESIVDYSSFMNYFMPELQEKHNFTFGELNASNAGNLEWFNSQWKPGRGGDFLYLGEDPAFNPNATEMYPCLKTFWEKVRDQKNYPGLSNLSDIIITGWEQIEMYLWYKTMPNCKGLLLFDATDNVYNMVYGPFKALPVLYINGSIGKSINESINDYNISFWVNQSWNENVESYNVVGQINGTNQNETVILDCLYDGWWNQASADSAIGIGIILSIAKYFQDYNITPKCNVKFIAFGGEEFGLRGAFYYEAKYSNENITTVIDLNQLGIAQTNPRLDFNIVLNNESLNSTIGEIANCTQYIERTGNTSDFRIINTSISFVASDYKPFAQNQSRNCNTLCFIEKTLGEHKGTWVFHHRDGLDHEEGDSMKNIDWNDVNVTAEMIWNYTKYFTVNPDCWFENTDISVIDSDDVDDLVDTISFSFDVTSTLPHDLAMVNYSLTKAMSDDVVTFENINFTVNRSSNSITVNITLPSGESPGFFVFRNDLYNSTGRINEIIDYTDDNSNQSYSSGFIFLYPYNSSASPPNIINITVTPDSVGYGYNVTISADVTSNASTIDQVTVNITYPDDTTNSYNMSNTAGDTYQYVFNDTWQYEQYDYVIWAKDTNGNQSGSSQHSYNVTINATISVCTIKDSYGNNENINITDPPSNPPLIGYELLDNGKVLRIWNKYDSYYFDTDNGVQFTNHYDEYWSHNVLMLGYYNNDEWNLIYRSDDLSGFNQDIESDDTTYVNATLWKNLSYKGYDFRLAIRYHLGVEDNELTVIPYIKNIDDEDIPYVLGFAWEIKDIQVDMTTSGDYIEINRTTYYLNQDLDETYKNMDNPCYYIREDFSGDKSKSLYLRWDENLNDIVQVKSRDGQYNAPVTLGVKIGTLYVGQEKQTKMFWHDADEAIYYFNNYNTGEAWASIPSYMVDGITSNYASTTVDGDVELCNSSNCSGSDLGTISKVELRVFGYYTGDPRDIILRPVFNGTIDGSDYNYIPPPSSGIWSPWFDITNDPVAPAWSWSDIQGLDCDVEVGPGMLPFTLYCSKVEIRVTYSPPTYPPEISDPYPPDNSTGIGLTPMLNITVVDPNGDNMTISWLSNSSGSWQVFGTNNSLSNGTYHQIMSNASVNGQWWYWKVNVSDGTNYTESGVYKFYTGYESKIVNTGSTHFNGYLLIQVQFYNETSESWVVADDTINETSPRTFLWADPGGSPGQNILGLDTIFNGNVTTNSLAGFGNGTYRVYACLRNPSGGVLYVGDSISQGAVENEYLETWYEFTVTFE